MKFTIDEAKKSNYWLRNKKCASTSINQKLRGIGLSETEIANEGENNIDLVQNGETPAAIENDAATGEVSNEETTKKQDELLLNPCGEIVWNNNIIARLLPNQPLFAPKIELLGEELNRDETANVVFERLYSWLDEQVRSELFALTRLKAAIDFVPSENEEPAKSEEPEQVATEENAEAVTGEVKENTAPVKTPKLPLSDVAKALAIKVHEANGILDRALVEKEIHELTQDNRRELRNFGVKFGRSAIYLPLLLKPKAASLNAILTHFSKGKAGEVFVPRIGVTSFNAVDGVNQDDYILTGFKNVGGRVIRLDILDRVIDALFEASKEAKGPIAMPMAVVSLLGVSNEVASNVVEGLGWEKSTDEEGNVKWSLPKKRFVPRAPRNEVRSDSNTGEKRFERKFDSKPRPQQNQGYGKKRKDKDIKPKTRHDYKSREESNIADSPFAILAKLKDNMGN